MDFQHLAEIATGEVPLLRPDRITVRHGNTQVDIREPGLYHDEPDAVYTEDSGEYRVKVVDQQEAEALVQGASF